MNKQHWTQQEKEALTFMYNAGTPASGIAKSLGRTEKAVHNYIHRNRDSLGLGRRKSEVKPSVAMPTEENKRGWLAWIDRLLK
tara:strand:- start:284 stop:532 length:249 start_codon:yes stop_codon:yes gene_type:complete